MEAVVATCKPRLQGKKVMLYVGGLRPRHESALQRVGGSCRHGLRVRHDGRGSRARRTTSKTGTSIDDVTGYEVGGEDGEPDALAAVKEKYIFQKMGIPFRCIPGSLRAPITAISSFHLRPRYGIATQLAGLEAHQGFPLLDGAPPTPPLRLFGGKQKHVQDKNIVQMPKKSWTISNLECQEMLKNKREKFKNANP